MSTIFDNLESVLNIGQSRDRFGICCPDCEESNGLSVHVIASIEEYIICAESIELNECCFNLFATVETYLQFEELFSVENPQFLDSLKVEGINGNILAVTSGETACLDNNFYSCITQISGLCDDFSVFVDYGITEYNTLNGQSSICELKDFIVNNSLTTSQAQDLLTLILVNGSVSSCLEDSLVMGTVQKWLQYAESFGLTG